MILFAWIVRALLLILVLPFLIPFGLLFSLIIASPLSLALFVLVLALLALGTVLGIALGVIGNLVDLVIVLGLIGIVWNWPRGAQGRFTEKLRLAYHRLRATLYRQVQQFTAADLAVTLVVILIAVVLSLSSGLIHFLLTLVIILAVVGIVWKWPHTVHLPFVTKLRLALVALRDELRGFFL
ncbi:MAG: hypothetical protein U9Q94_06795 [Candidatus Bipolaricaulota bacterium]|nr:hypothetical protein [Candidatus Bipolaricaulota bacterium]